MGQYLMNAAPSAKRQRGVVLLIALIALVAMTLAGIALMRSVDTSNVIAGNFAFKESTLHATDRGTELAIADLQAKPVANRTTPAANQYYPVRQAADALGLPTTVDWNAVTKSQIAGTGDSVQYVVERMCDPIPASSGVAASPNGPDENTRTDVTDYCVTAPQCSPGVSITSPPFCVAGDIYYRVTTRVTGPRGTVSIVQSVVSM